MTRPTRLVDTDRSGLVTTYCLQSRGMVYLILGASPGAPEILFITLGHPH